VRREGIVIKNNGRSITVHIEVVPFTTAAKGHYQLVFFEVAAPTPRASRKQGKRVVVPAADSRQSSQLRKELRHTREYLQSVIEEQDGMNEELRSANEEIQSSNEELQSMNEELETAKEELQSTNEELTTLNEELENRNAELAEAHNDLLNLLTSIDVPLVMLDSKLRVRRFNPAAQRIMSLRLDDIGRPISTIKMAFSRDDLEDVVASVIDDLEVREVDVRDASDRWHLLRVRPYKTAENRIEGAVLVLVSGDPLKRAGEPPGERGELL
jgi:two-component system CheB/CheR fusion protein